MNRKSEFLLHPGELTGTCGLLKRLFDLSLGLLILIITIIPGVIIAILVKLDSPGPVLYKQIRVGLYGKKFILFKFRSMVKSAEKLFEELRFKNERQGPVFKIAKDPRTTRIGKFLRKYSIDELPQILNVIRGEMSIVGPRPPIPWEVEHYNGESKRRLHTLPGLTGVWQIKGRSHLSFDEMIKLDNWYLENQSLALDINIILKTISAVLSCRGAY